MYVIMGPLRHLKTDKSGSSLDGVTTVAFNVNKFSISTINSTGFNLDC